MVLGMMWEVGGVGCGMSEGERGEVTFGRALPDKF